MVWKYSNHEIPECVNAAILKNAITGINRYVTGNVCVIRIYVFLYRELCGFSIQIWKYVGAEIL